MYATLKRIFVDISGRLRKKDLPTYCTMGVKSNVFCGLEGMSVGPSKYKMTVRQSRNNETGYDEM